MNQKILSLILASLLLGSLTACSSSTDTAEEETATIYTEEDSHFVDEDYEVGYSDYETVSLEDDASTSDGEHVTIDGNTITITRSGTYLLSGDLSNGQIIVNTSDSGSVQLVFDNASIHCTHSPPVSVTSDTTVYITTASDSVSTLSSDASDGVIYTTGTITLNGCGTLVLDATAGNAVTSLGTIKITSGDYDITAANTGFYAEENLYVASGSFLCDCDTTSFYAVKDLDISYTSLTDA